MFYTLSWKIEVLSWKSPENVLENNISLAVGTMYTSVHDFEAI